MAICLSLICKNYEKIYFFRNKKNRPRCEKNDQQTSDSIMPIVQLINVIPKEPLSKEGELRNFILRVNNESEDKLFKYHFL